MVVSWQRYPSEDLVLGEFPAPIQRLIERRKQDAVKAELAETFNRPVVEFDGLVVNHEINDIERYARVMGWDDES